MLKKLTNLKNSGMKKEFRERCARANCHYVCLVSCEDLVDVYFTIRLMLNG